MSGEMAPEAEEMGRPGARAAGPCQPSDTGKWQGAEENRDLGSFPVKGTPAQVFGPKPDFIFFGRPM